MDILDSRHNPTPEKWQVEWRDPETDRWTYYSGPHDQKRAAAIAWNVRYVLSPSWFGQSVPTRSVVQRGEVPVENPPWVNKTLAKNIEEIQTQVPAEWLPKLSRVRATARGEMAVNFQEYGCGTYGCVLPTYDEDVVLKVTTDVSEVDFVELAQPWGWPAGMSHYYGLERLPDRQKVRKNLPPFPVALLWRESARFPGKLADKSAEIDKLWPVDVRKQAAYLVSAAYDTGVAAWIDLVQEPPHGITPADLYAQAKRQRERAKALVEWLVTQRGIGKGFFDLLTDLPDEQNDDIMLALYLEGYRQVAEAMRGNAALSDVGDALLFYLGHDILMADLHLGNFGVVMRDGRSTWAVIDPGNVTVLPGPWA